MATVLFFVVVARALGCAMGCVWTAATLFSRVSFLQLMLRDSFTGRALFCARADG
jgi:hypothetical protein